MFFLLYINVIISYSFKTELAINKVNRTAITILNNKQNHITNHFSCSHYIVVTSPRNQTFNIIYWLHMLCILFTDHRYMPIHVPIHWLSPRIRLMRKTKYIKVDENSSQLCMHMTSFQMHLLVYTPLES